MNDELYHHGIKGQKWGIRRYQNPDGSLTPAGRTRYGGERARAYRARELDRYEQTFDRAVRRGSTQVANEAVRQMISLSRMNDQQIAEEAARFNNAQHRGAVFAIGAAATTVGVLLGGPFAGGAIGGAVAGGVQGAFAGRADAQRRQERAARFANDYKNQSIETLRQVNDAYATLRAMYNS